MITFKHAVETKLSEEKNFIAFQLMTRNLDIEVAETKDFNTASQVEKECELSGKMLEKLPKVSSFKLMLDNDVNKAIDVKPAVFEKIKDNNGYYMVLDIKAESIERLGVSNLLKAKQVQVYVSAVTQEQDIITGLSDIVALSFSSK
ncbi:hypothetical protein QNJ25_03740 [Macrococcus caseolyticus]|uniref:hypothetical protein n=1 Tax=Macrococcoides caseolyticum TaxID=69966 RepID=UPI0024BCFC2D|nr:hypothetical protein [Macrococcus caseolyticus]MDJ1153030.1 hypothetical protein [Macrococcus caseolyticus]